MNSPTGVENCTPNYISSSESVICAESIGKDFTCLVRLMSLAGDRV